MNPLLKTMNRGPIFRFTHALACWQKRRQFARWRRQMNVTSAIDPDAIFAGNLDALESAQIGAGTEIQRQCRIWLGDEKSDNPKLILGRRVFIGQGTHLSVMQPLTIGNDTLIGANCYLLTCQHRFESRTIPIRDQGYDCQPLNIGEAVWIGANCVIMPGIEIWRGAIIGACSVVTKNVGAFEIWAGVPAKKIKDRP